MDIEKMKEILRLEFGICSEEEFNEAVKNSCGINIGILTTILEDSKKEQSEKTA